MKSGVANCCRRRLSAAETHRGGPELAQSATAADLVAQWMEPADDHLMVVGCYEGSIVGLGAATAGEGGRGTIACCYVEEEARGVGVGSALVAALMDYLATHGCDDVDASALPGDRHTKQLLEAAGFKARLLVLHRRLR